MTDNKLYSIFLSLDGVEKRAMNKLINSPFFNQNVINNRLWDWLVSSTRGRNKALPATEIGFNQIFPNEKFDDLKWRHAQSQLVTLIERMLSERAFVDMPLLADLELAPIYREKKLPQSLSHLFNRSEKKLAKLPKDRNFYHLEYQLELEKFKSIESKERGVKNNLSKVAGALDIYLIASKLRVACMQESHKSVYNADYEASFLPLLLTYIQSNSSIIKNPVIALYYYCYQSLSAGTESDFRSLRKALGNEALLISVDERREFLLLAINFCIKQLNSGHERYIREAFDLYQTGLKTKTLISDELLSRYAYKNIVALGLKLKEFDWVEDFIHKYADLLAAAHREANRNYNLARLYFTKKEFNKAMPMLVQIDDNDLLLNLDSRVMLLKMYFEMGEIDPLDNLLTSFRILLLRKKKVIGYHQQHYLNMLRYIRKMIKLNRYDKAAVEAFKKEVAANPGVIEKEWILETV